MFITGALSSCIEEHTFCLKFDILNLMLEILKYQINICCVNTVCFFRKLILNFYWMRDVGSVLEHYCLFNHKVVYAIPCVFFNEYINMNTSCYVICVEQGP